MSGKTPTRKTRSASKSEGKEETSEEEQIASGFSSSWSDTGTGSPTLPVVAY